MTVSIPLLKDLTEAHGVSGYEEPVSNIVYNYLKDLGSVTKDQIGSLICEKSGREISPRVMIVGHMDEIGFMVKYITDEGYIKFIPLGGWFDQVLLGQRVTIHTYIGDITGVIGVKPPHMLSADERKKVVEKKDMYIDIGAVSKAEVISAGVRIGDPIIPKATFEVMANGKSLLSKAFDDRLGVALVIKALESLQERDHPNTIFGVASVMEEVGPRGAKTSVEVVKPDIAIVLEADIAGDVPGMTKEECDIRLGCGPSLLMYDYLMIPNLKLRDYVIETAQKCGIPLQLSTMAGGATDGAAIHLYKTGVPTVVIGVPTRHVHSHSSIMHLDDFENASKLVNELILSFDSKTVSNFTN